MLGSYLWSRIFCPDLATEPPGNPKLDHESVQVVFLDGQSFIHVIGSVVSGEYSLYAARKLIVEKVLNPCANGKAGVRCAAADGPEAGQRCLCFDANDGRAQKSIYQGILFLANNSTGLPQ